MDSRKKRKDKVHVKQSKIIICVMDCPKEIRHCTSSGNCLQPKSIDVRGSHRLFTRECIVFKKIEKDEAKRKVEEISQTGG